jgi:hypothetical protein
MRRAAPAIALFFLSPLVAEFLLGDFTITVLWLLFALAPMYGGGAILIREVVRRTGRGWPSIVLLGLAYAVLEEGVTTMSLFNPDYADAHLLDTGFVPALGIAIPWTVFVLALHTVWSISVPIALVEEWTDRRTQPWLRTPGLIVAVVLFAVGAFGSTMSTYGQENYFAGWPKLLIVGVIVVLLVVAAFLLPRRSASPSSASSVSAASASAGVFAGVRHGVRPAPRPWVVLVVLLVFGGLFEGAQAVPGQGAGAAAIGVVMMVVALAGAAVSIGIWSRGAGWGSWHRLAAAAAGLLTYAWHSFFSTPLLGGSPIVTPISHTFLALAAVALLGFEVRRIRRRENAPAAVGASEVVAEA